MNNLRRIPMKIYKYIMNLNPNSDTRLKFISNDIKDMLMKEYKDLDITIEDKSLYGYDDIQYEYASKHPMKDKEYRFVCNYRSIGDKCIRECLVDTLLDEIIVMTIRLK